MTLAQATVECSLGISRRRRFEQEWRIWVVDARQRHCADHVTVKSTCFREQFWINYEALATLLLTLYFVNMLLGLDVSRTTLDLLIAAGSESL